MDHIRIDTWPVECPYRVYSSEFEHQQARAEIWRYDPRRSDWQRMYQAPIVIGHHGEEMSRDLGYRGMSVFRGPSDTVPALYVSNVSRSHDDGPIIMRTEDGKTFVPVSEPGLIGLPVTSLRLLVPFKGRLFTAPTGTTDGNPNMSGVTLILESRDPAKGKWQPINEPSFGDPNNRTVFELRGFAGHLYAGTANNEGFQIWRTRAEGTPPYHWEKVISQGAGRGSLNQIATSMIPFRNALYIGTGIQNGGYDHANDIGPAGAEIIRINRDGSWDLLIGDIRDDGRKPLSGIAAGFNNICNGYVWRMGIHRGWLYAGTMEWSIFLRYISFEGRPERTVRMLQKVNVESIINNQGGFDLWRTADGVNWMPVTLRGFDNPYNYGVRNIVSTPYGAFIGTTNPFGPRVAVLQGERWIYEDNPEGGLEIWQGI
jgi:hypothetical protein